jgi:hypothetical protein
MSLDRTKLEKVRDLAGGGIQARCPACAEAGQDRKGQHLRISPEGKFGCCVFPGDRKHRSRIFALAGERGPKAIKVRVAEAKPAETVQLDLSAFAEATENLGRLGRVVSSADGRVDGREGQTGDLVSTLPTLGTFGTLSYSLRSYGEKNCIQKLIEFRGPVPSVPAEVQPPSVEVCGELEGRVPSVPEETGGREQRDAERRLPYLTAAGDLVIPFDSPERYHWWKGGQAIRETRRELLERKENDASPF